MTIRSLEGEFFADEQKAIFNGNVGSKLPKTKIFSNRLVINVNNDKEYLDARNGLQSLIDNENNPTVSVSEISIAFNKTPARVYSWMKKDTFPERLITAGTVIKLPRKEVIEYFKLEQQES